MVMWCLWLDDQLFEVKSRRPPEGFVGARCVREAKLFVKSFGLPYLMDLDHDLGNGEDALVFLKWLSDHYPNGPVPRFSVHSENPVGKKNIECFLDSWKRSIE